MGPSGADASQRGLRVAAACLWARSPHLSHRQRAIEGPGSRPQRSRIPSPSRPRRATGLESHRHGPPRCSQAPLSSGDLETVQRSPPRGEGRGREGRSGVGARLASSSRRFGAAPAGLPPPRAPRPRPRPDAPSGAGAPACPAPRPAIPSAGGNAQTGFPPRRAPAGGAGWTPAGQGCREDPAEIPAACGAELRPGTSSDRGTRTS